MASPGFGARRGTKTYYEIHAVNSDKAIDLYTVLLDRQPHGIECQSVCGSEVTLKNSTAGNRGRGACAP